MLSVCELRNKGAARNGAQGVASYLFAAEYYASPDGCGVWLGSGAAALGFAGTVERGQFEQALNGFGPNGAALVQNAGEPDRRLGYDLTFSADKSVSLLFAVADAAEQDRILAAHHTATQAALDYMPAQLEARRGRGGAVRLPVSGVAVARFDHFSSRSGDIDLHSHCVLLNAALGPDGKTGTFDGEPIQSLKHSTGALYRAELTAQLMRLGYHIDSEREQDAAGHETGQVWHRVAGIGRDEREAFSRRRAEVLARQAQTGETAETATLASRQEKEHGEPPRCETVAKNRARLLALRDANGWKPWTSENLKHAHGHALDRLDDAGILRRLHAHESAWTLAQLVDRIAKERPDLGARGALAEVDAFLARASIVPLTPDHRSRARWASREQVAIEQSIADRAAAGMADQSARVRPETLATAITEHERAQDFTLSAEQRAAVAHVATDTGRVAVLQGWAGSGKTATAGAYIRAFQAEGRQVLGCAVAWKAAEKLADETGLECRSVALMLAGMDKGAVRLDRGAVVILDEAGMVGARDVARLLDYTEAAGAKLVMLGDPCQLQPVAAGAAMRLAGDRVGLVAQTEIRRQRERRDRETAAAFYGQGCGRDIVRRWRETGQLDEAETVAHAQAALVAEWLTDARPIAGKLVLAGTNEQCHALTVAMRAGLKARGNLANARAVSVRGALKDETCTLDLAPGDRVRFTKQERCAGVVNGTRGTIEDIRVSGDGRHRLRVRLGQSGRVVEVESGADCALAYDYAATVHRAQGQTVAATYWLATGGNTSRSLGLVAATRHRDALRVFTADAAQLAARIDDWRAKENAADLLPQQPTPEARQEAQARPYAGLAALLAARHGQRNEAATLLPRLDRPEVPRVHLSPPMPQRRPPRPRP
ncbi:MAG: MobF family relaxase [Rhodanobacteraceae bacterium]